MLILSLAHKSASEEVSNKQAFEFISSSVLNYYNNIKCSSSFTIILG